MFVGPPFSRLFFIVFALCVATSAAMNFVLNPLGVFRHPSPIIGDNRPDQHVRIRLAKAFAVARVKPNAVILGNSRANYGLSPDHQAFAGFRTYNLAFGDQTLDESLRFLEHAHRISGVRRVVLGLNPRLPVGIHDSFDPELLCRMNDHVCTSLGLLSRHLISIAWFRAIADNWQGRRARVQYLTNGLRDPELNRRFVVEAGGSSAAFARFAEGERRRADRGQPFLQPNGADRLESLFSFAHQGSMELTVVIEPTHVLRWDLFREVTSDGLDGVDIAFREIVAANLAAAQHAGRPPFPIWDFSAATSYTTESIPDTEGRVMRWHWEQNHYRKELGDIVLARAFGLAASSDTFGTRLTAENIESYLSARRRGIVQANQRIVRPTSN